MEGKLKEAQCRERLATEQVAELRQQLQQQAAETQHCNAEAEVPLSDSSHSQYSQCHLWLIQSLAVNALGFSN